MSIYGDILENTDANGRLSTYELPDDAGPSGDMHAAPLRYAPGAQEGIATYHMAHIEFDEGAAEALVREMSQVARRVSPSLETTSGFKAQLEHAGGDATQVEFFDPDFESLAAQNFTIHNAGTVLEMWAKTDPHRWETALLGALLATTSKRRQAVKLGTALIGYAGANFWQDELTVLGKHPEFTIWAVKALGETIGIPDRRTEALMQIFERTEGWGKVRVLEALTQSPSAEVQYWMLRSALDEDWLVGAYCALPIAESARLAAALQAPHLDDDLFEGATRILNALIEEDPPNGDLSGYGDGLAAVESWLRHTGRRRLGPGGMELLDKLRSLREYAWSDALESRWGKHAVDRVVSGAYQG